MNKKKLHLGCGKRDFGPDWSLASKPMVLVVFHDLNGKEVYINPVEVCAVVRTEKTLPGATIVFSGISVQVRETPGAVKYVLNAL